ncbi:MAG: hypothetical protein IPK16_09580 [Anaerolineales bacterium]|nr:hypothetical protein [Anaerolineales bacterium]
MKHPFVLLRPTGLLFAIAVLAYMPAQAASPTVAVARPNRKRPARPAGVVVPFPSPAASLIATPPPMRRATSTAVTTALPLATHFFSISQRFGVSAANRRRQWDSEPLADLGANQFILIPGLGIAPAITPTPPR